MTAVKFVTLLVDGESPGKTAGDLGGGKGEKRPSLRSDRCEVGVGRRTWEGTCDMRHATDPTRVLGGIDLVQRAGEAAVQPLLRFLHCRSEARFFPA